MTGPLAHLHLSYMANICSILKSNNVLIDSMTSFKCYQIIYLSKLILNSMVELQYLVIVTRMPSTGK